ncbi:hypothetical protein [Reyranella sp.]|uniref:hypothetical protein n=1 Tax=Reyranella sp. TaxID=1929291 RepID=UPI003BABA82C
MSIADFQRAFADLIASPSRCLRLRDGADDAFAGYELTALERLRLGAMARDEAMSVNCSLYRVNRLIPVYSVLPHSCRLLGDRLMVELEAFWAASRHATLQYRWEAWRFGLWLQRRIDAGLLPGGPVEDAICLEMAIFDTQAASRDGADASARRRIVRLRHEPEALLDPALAPDELVPSGDEIAVLVDASGPHLAVGRVSRDGIAA